LSAVGANGAFAAVNHPVEIGSPGTVGAPPTPVVTIAATDAMAAETGADPGTFRVTRTGSTVGALTVNYTIATGPTQASTGDYTPALSGSVTIASGQSFVDITITPIDDALFERPETLTLTLGDSGSYDVGAPAAATVTIADNDPPVTRIDSMPANPSGMPAAHFAFSASNAGSGVATFECSIDDSLPVPCTAGSVDYTVAPGGHTFSVPAIDQANASNRDASPETYAWTVVVPPSVTSTGFVRDRRTATYAQQITITNNNAVALTGPFFLVLDALSANATLVNATGTTTISAPLGSPYITVPGGTLAPGDTASLVLPFA